jgi:ferredoxin
MCVVESPAVFDLAKGATTVTILVAELDESQLAEVRQAVKYCPNAALSLTD